MDLVNRFLIWKFLICFNFVIFRSEFYGYLDFKFNFNLFFVLCFIYVGILYIVYLFFCVINIEDIIEFLLLRYKGEKVCFFSMGKNCVIM